MSPAMARTQKRGGGVGVGLTMKAEIKWITKTLMTQ